MLPFFASVRVTQTGYGRRGAQLHAVLHSLVRRVCALLPVRLIRLSAPVITVKNGVHLTIRNEMRSVMRDGFSELVCAASRSGFVSPRERKNPSRLAAHCANLEG